MSRHTLSRIDRVAQMSIQEEIIAKKKLELIEKQKTVELAKQVVAAQTGNSAKPKKEKPATLHKPNVVLEPPSPKNNFNNDGSFFENFKKITDAAKKAQEDAMPPPPPVVVEVPPEELAEEPTTEIIEINDVPLIEDPTLLINKDITEVFISNFQQNAAALCSAPPPPPPPPPSPPKPAPPSEAETDSSYTFMSEPSTHQPNESFQNHSDYSVTFDDNNDDEFDDTATSPSCEQRPPNYQLGNFQEFTPHAQHSTRPNTNFPPPSGPRDFHQNFATPMTSVPPPNFNPTNRFGGDQSFHKPIANQFDRLPQETNSFSNEPPPSVSGGRGPAGNPSFMGGNNNFMSNSQNNQFPCDTNEYSDDDTDNIAFNGPPPPLSNRFAANQSQSSGQFSTASDQQIPPQNNNPFGPGAGNRFGGQPNQNRFNQFPHGGSIGAPNRIGTNNRFGPEMTSPTISPNPNYQNPFANNTNKPPPPHAVPMLNKMPPFSQPPPTTVGQPQQQQQPPPSTSVAFISGPPPSTFADRPRMAFAPPIVNTSVAPPSNASTTMVVALQPPPNMFAQFPPLHTIPPPKPMSLNTIPPPRELDLTVIPEPTLDLDAIKVPDHSISRDHEFIPTSVESLVDLVAENGDEYEDKLRLRKIDMHSSLWFLCEKGSLAYRNYRKKVMEVRYNTTAGSQEDDGSDKYDPAEMYDDYKDDDDDDDDNNDGNPGNNSDSDRFNDNDAHNTTNAKQQPPTEGATNVDYDSDAEYRTQSNKRNYAQMKRNLDNSHNRDYYSSDTDDDDDRDHGGGSGCSSKNDTLGGGGGGGSDSSTPAPLATPTVATVPRAVDIDMRIMPQIMMRKQKRSRWGDKDATARSSAIPPPPQPPIMLTMPTVKHNPFGVTTSTNKIMLTGVTRSDPALLQYARANYGSINLDEDEWRKCEDHYKVNLLYQDLLKKRNEIDRLASSGRFKYEYDSDEDVSGGTWEHKLRNAEMEATAVWSDALTKQAEGKHHIGDFLPPEELKKFMEKYESQQNNREPDISDYREYKLKEDNKGFQMLQKLGWKEGQGLGFGGSGIVDPVNKAHQRDSNQGLGAMTSSGPDFGDNEYDAYRKRMMLAYRFRPNPLNNPRRAYY